MSSSNGLSNFIKIGTAGNDDDNKRIDRIIRTIIPSFSLGTIYKEIRKGRIRINEKKITPETRIKKGDLINIHKSLLEIIHTDVEKIGLKNENQENNNRFRNLKIETLFENDMLIAVNKPAGMLIHAGAKNSKNSLMLDTIIKNYLIEKSEKSLAFSPAPLHRLDKETSGIVFFSKSIEGARLFTSLLSGKMFIKRYITLLDGHLPEKYVWKDFLSHADSINKEAITSIEPLIYSEKHTLALAEIETGRYHQIRKQCSMHGFPLSGDEKYGGVSFKENRQNKVKNHFLLHCWNVEIKDKNETEKLGFNSITAPIPEAFIRKADVLFKKENIDDLILKLYDLATVKYKSKNICVP